MCSPRPTYRMLCVAAPRRPADAIGTLALAPSLIHCICKPLQLPAVTSSELPYVVESGSAAIGLHS